MYEIKYRSSVAKELRKLPKGVLGKVVERIQKLADDPMPSGVQRLKGTSNVYRLRQGNYRIVYSVDKGELVVLIVKVAHRRDVYRNL